MAIEGLLKRPSPVDQKPEVLNESGGYGCPAGARTGASGPGDNDVGLDGLVLFKSFFLNVVYLALPI